MAAKSRQTGREALLRVTPTSGWLPVSLPETAGWVWAAQNLSFGAQDAVGQSCKALDLQGTLGWDRGLNKAAAAVAVAWDGGLSCWELRN